MLSCLGQDSITTIPEPVIEGSSSTEKFFLNSEGLECWQVCQSLSDYFNLNIIVFDDIKHKKVFGQVKGLSVRECLNVLAWLLGVEWVEQDGIYFLGGNRKNILVRDSVGLPSDISTVIPNVNVLGDKIVVVGTEREIKRVSDALEKLSSRSYVNVWLYVFEMRFDDRVDIGIDWRKMITYSASWDALIRGQFNPAQTLAISFVASAKLEEYYLDFSSLIDTNLGVMSGSETTFSITDDTDREVFNESGDGYRVVSGYSTQQSGLILSLKGYKVSGGWMFDVKFENSRAESSTQKRAVKLSNSVLVSPGNTVLLGCINEKSVYKRFEKGWPWLSRVPILGWLFALHEDRLVHRRLIALLSLEPLPEKDLPSRLGSVPDALYWFPF